MQFFSAAAETSVSSRIVQRKQQLLSKAQIKLTAAIIMMAAFAFRLPGLFHNTLHPDEALFGTWARSIASGRDPLLTSTLIDKPPLLFYVQAVSLRLFSYDEIALRLPSLVAGMLLCVLSACVVWRLTGKRSAQLAALALTAASPMLIQFSNGAFTDMMMLCWVAFALLAVVVKRPATAGILFGLAIATKLQALLLLPLLCAVAINFRLPWRRLAVGLLLPLGALGLWFMATQDLSLWLTTGDASLLQSLRPISSHELLPRLNIWREHLTSILGIDGIVVFSMALVAALSLRDRWLHLLLSTAVVYFSFHWLFATATHDRYMLPLAWLLILALSILIGHLSERLHKRPAPMAAICVLACALLVLGMRGRAGLYEVGGLRSADFGTANVTELFDDAPYGTVVYDHWYSWQLRYHLFESRAYVEWVPHPAQLVIDLDAFYDAQRYIVLPTDASATPFVRRLAQAGYQLETRLQSGEIAVYQIVRQ